MLLFCGRDGPWSVAGKGGEMSETVQTLEIDDASGTRGSTTKTRKRNAGAGRTARTSGAERLRRAANKKVGRKSDELAEALLNKALKGDVASTKALVDLADGMKPEPARKRDGLSYAQLLMADLEENGEWKGEWEDGDE